MKKLLFATCLALASMSGVLAEDAATQTPDCTQGKLIYGKDNNKVFCQSRISMNWYTAWAWCDAQGLRLATMQDMCDTSTTKYFLGDKCENMNAVSSGDAWSATPNGTESAYRVPLLYGSVASYHRTNSNFAVCVW